jgi:hypothetical protein
LNFNDFYSHNKIQEHFITPRKVCNGMNAIIKYLFKYINYRILFFFGKIGCYNSYHSWWLISNWSHQLSFQPNTRVDEFIPLFYHSNQTRGRMNSSLTSRIIPFHPSLTLNQTHPKWLDYVPQLRCLVEMWVPWWVAGATKPCSCICALSFAHGDMQRTTCWAQFQSWLVVIGVLRTVEKPGKLNMLRCIC